MILIYWDGYIVKIGQSLLAIYTEWKATSKAVASKLWRMVWRTLAPTKVKYFMSWVARRACLTDDVMKKKMTLVSWYSLCGKAEETNNHLFWHCRFTTQIWIIFLSLTEITGTMPEHTVDLLSWWIRIGESKSHKAWGEKIPHITSGGGFGERREVAILMLFQIPFKRLSEINLYPFIFGVNKQV